MKILKSIGLMSLMFTIAMIGFGSSIAQATTYTLADVTTHNTPADCWVIVNNNVYNLTSFINSHSGGSSVIKAQCGKNGTASFASGPHSASTLNAISSSLLGPLVMVTPILTSLTVVPSAPTILVGGSIQLNANLKDQNGKKFTGATTTFSSSNTAIATVGSTSGTVTGVALGTATITTTAIKGAVTITKTSTVTVSATAPTINTDNNGKHLGQYKHWFEKWFKKWEKRQGESEKNDHERNDQRDNDNEENDD